jgi:hypothetical protein
MSDDFPITQVAGESPILNYGEAESFRRRVLRHIPRPSIWTCVLLIAACCFGRWLQIDHQVWIVKRTLPGTTAKLNGFITRDGTRLLVGSDAPFDYLGSPFRIIDIRTGIEQTRFGDPLEFATHAIFSPDETQVLTVGGMINRTVSGGGSTKSVYGDANSQPVRLWNAVTGKLIANLDPLGRLNSSFGSPCPLFFSPNGRRIVTLDTFHARLYDNSGKLLANLEPNCGDRVYFSPDSQKCVVSTNGSLPMRIHSDVDGSVRSETPLEHGTSNQTHGLFSPDGRTFACTCNEWAWLINAADGAMRGQPIMLGGHDEGVWYSADGSHLFIVVDTYPKQVLHSIDTATGSIVAKIPSIGYTDMRVTWLADQKVMVLTAWDNESETVQSDPLTSVATFNAHGIARFSKDRSRFLCREQNSRTLDIFSTSPWRETSQIVEETRPGMGDYLTDAQFLPNPRQLLTATDQRLVQLWERRRPESAWGVFVLPQCCLAIVFTIGFFVSAARDFLQFYRRSSVVAVL